MPTWETSLEKMIYDYLTHSKHLAPEIYSHCKNFKKSDVDNALRNLRHWEEIVVEIDTGYYRVI